MESVTLLSVAAAPVAVFRMPPPVLVNVPPDTVTPSAIPPSIRAAGQDGSTRLNDRAEAGAVDAERAAVGGAQNTLVRQAGDIRLHIQQRAGDVGVDQAAGLVVHRHLAVADVAAAGDRIVDVDQLAGAEGGVSNITVVRGAPQHDQSAAGERDRGAGGQIEAGGVAGVRHRNGGVVDDAARDGQCRIVADQQPAGVTWNSGADGECAHGESIAAADGRGAAVEDRGGGGGAVRHGDRVPSPAVPQPPLPGLVHRDCARAGSAASIATSAIADTPAESARRFEGCRSMEPREAWRERSG